MIENSELCCVLTVSLESRKMAQEIVPQIKSLALTDEGTFLIVCNLQELVDDIVFTNKISILDLAQNNFEFLDNLRAITFRLYDANKITKKQFTITRDRIDKNLEKLKKITSIPTRKHIRRIFTGKKSDKDFTEPKIVILISSSFILRLTYNSVMRDLDGW